MSDNIQQILKHRNSQINEELSYKTILENRKGILVNWDCFIKILIPSFNDFFILALFYFSNILREYLIIKTSGGATLLTQSPFYRCGNKDTERNITCLKSHSY